MGSNPFIIGAIGLAAVAVVAAGLNYSDWEAEHKITDGLAAIPAPEGPLTPLSFSDYHEMGVWCGLAWTQDKRNVAWLAKFTGTEVQVHAYPKGAPEDGPALVSDPRYWPARLEKTAFVNCMGFHLGRTPSLDIARLIWNQFSYEGRIISNGPAHSITVEMSGTRYRIPGEFLENRMPSAGDNVEVESELALRGTVPDYGPGRVVGANGVAVPTKFQPGFGNRLTELVDVPQRDPGDAQSGLRPLMFRNFQIISETHDGNGSHLVYENARDHSPAFRLTDVYLRDNSTDWVYCHVHEGRFPYCVMHIRDGALLHQITFGLPWLKSRWRIADAVRNRWSSWQIPSFASKAN